MQVNWDAREEYSEVGGQGFLRAAFDETLARVPREHLRLLDSIDVFDKDPKGKALGVWRQHNGATSIEIYLAPHVTDALRAPKTAQGFVLRLYLAHTVFHEVGHHVTRVLNRRAAPRRKAAQVDHTIEKWAEQYAEKRLVRLVNDWRAALSSEEEAALAKALRVLDLTRLFDAETDDKARSAATA